MIGLTPSAGMLHDDDSQWARTCRVVRLCPALRPRETKQRQRNRAKIMVSTSREPDFDGDEESSFTVQPNEIGHLDIFISDPPIAGANVFPRYKHIGTSCWAYVVCPTAYRASGLTIGAVFEQAKSTTYSSVWLDVGGDVPGQGCVWKMMRKSTLNAVTSAYIKTYGGSFVLDLEASSIRLYAIVPTEEEWETMRQVLAEEEKKKKLMDPDEHAAWIEKLLRDSM